MEYITQILVSFEGLDIPHAIIFGIIVIAVSSTVTTYLTRGRNGKTLATRKDIDLIKTEIADHATRSAVMENKIENIEADIKEIKSDIKELLKLILKKTSKN